MRLFAPIPGMVVFIYVPNLMGGFVSEHDQQCESSSNIVGNCSCLIRRGRTFNCTHGNWEQKRFHLETQLSELRAELDYFKERHEECHKQLDLWKQKAERLAEALKRMITDSQYMREEYSDMNVAVDKAEEALKEFQEEK